MNDHIGFRPLPLPQGVSGRLYLSSMPGRYRAFDADLAQAEELAVSMVLCLNPRDEIEYKSPHYHNALNDGSHGWQVVEHPIEDFRAPQRGDGFATLIDEITGHLREGTNVMLHCAGGIGRTGTVSSCILIALGLSVEEALATVRAARAWPENKSQPTSCTGSPRAASRRRGREATRHHSDARSPLATAALRATGRPARDSSPRRIRNDKPRARGSS